jgi:arylsulfate sulfotransferase
MRLERNLPAFLASLALIACSGGSSSGGNPPPTPPAIVTGPTLMPNPNPEVPLAAMVELETDVPTEATLTLDDGTKVWSVTPQPGFSLTHQLAVLGVRPDKTVQITVEVRDQAGLETTAPAPVVFVTPPLPAGFPPLQLDVSDAARMEPGVTMFGPSAVGGVPGVTIAPLIMVDEEGEVVWYYNPGFNIGDARRMANGNLLVMGDSAIMEIDMFGNQVQLWWPNNIQPNNAPPGATLVAADSFHHEVVELPAGDAADFVTLSTEMRVLPDYPMDVVDRTQTQPTANVVGDVIVAFKRDGTVVEEWKLLDVLDPYRVSYDSLVGFWDTLYGMVTYDWSHGNAVVLDPTDDSWIVSLRHQDAVVKIERATGALEWILGDHERWFLPWAGRLLTPVPDDGSFLWNYHQHAPDVLSGGRLMMFDNGNGRAIPPNMQLPDPDRYSRALELMIDEAQMTVTHVWQNGGVSDPWYSRFLCDVDPLPMTDNVLVTDGGKVDPLNSRNWGRVFEVDRSDQGEIVFQLSVRDLSPVDPIGWTVYRAERLTSVYP